MASGKKADLPVIAGCLRALAGHLVNFSRAVEESMYIAGTNANPSTNVTVFCIAKPL